MDSASSPHLDPASSSGDLAPGALDARSGTLSRWLLTALAIGIAAALVNVTLSQFVAALRDALVLNPLFYFHQREMNIVLGVVDTLCAPVLAIVFALLSMRDRPVSTLRQRAWAPVAVGLVAMALLALFVELVGAFIVPGTTGSSSPAEVTARINELTAAQSGLMACALGVGLVFAAVALAPHMASTRRLPDWALAGALVGVVTSAYGQAPRAILLTVTTVRLAQVGDFTCVANSGASCYPQQMLDIALYSMLPALIGAAIGGLIGGALGARAVAPQPSAGPLPGAIVAGGTPTRQRARLVVALRYAAAGGIGALYALYTLALLSVSGLHPLIANETTVRIVADAAWTFALACLALGAPALWLALAATRQRRAATRTDRARRTLIRWLTLLAITLAIAAPASVLLFPGFYFGVGVAPTILAAFAVGGACGLIWRPASRAPRSRAPWRAGLLAAAPVWIGFSLVYAALAGATLYAVSQPANAGVTSCHGLGCGALLMVFLDGAIQICVNCIIFGLPAALFAGGLSALIRATVAR